MSLWQAIILGLIQGLSEFLPVSSSGHVLLFHSILGITTTADSTLTFIIVLNMGSLTALLLAFRKDVWALVKKPFQKTTIQLAVATLPLVFTTLLFMEFIELAFYTMRFLSFGFILTGVALLLSDRIKSNNKDIRSITFVDAVLVGCAQALAVLPGISRSGITITSAMARGIGRENAAKFSFLLSVPAAVGAMVFRLSRDASVPALLQDLGLLNLGAGFIAAAVSGYLAINFMLTIVKKARLKYFAIYYILALAAYAFLML